MQATCAAAATASASASQPGRWRASAGASAAPAPPGLRWRSTLSAKPRLAASCGSTSSSTRTAAHRAGAPVAAAVASASRATTPWPRHAARSDGPATRTNTRRGQQQPRATGRPEPGPADPGQHHRQQDRAVGARHRREMRQPRSPEFRRDGAGQPATSPSTRAGSRPRGSAGQSGGGRRSPARNRPLNRCSVRRSGQHPRRTPHPSTALNGSDPRAAPAVPATRTLVLGSTPDQPAGRPSSSTGARTRQLSDRWLPAAPWPAPRPGPGGRRNPGPAGDPRISGHDHLQGDRGPPRASCASGPGMHLVDPDGRSDDTGDRSEQTAPEPARGAAQAGGARCGTRRSHPGAATPPAGEQQQAGKRGRKGRPASPSRQPSQASAATGASRRSTGLRSVAASDG